MESRAHSPIHPSSELYDHRNQPDSLPVRSSFSDANANPLPGVRSYSKPELDRPVFDDDGDQEYDEATLRMRSSSANSTAPILSTPASAATHPPRRRSSARHLDPQKVYTPHSHRSSTAGSATSDVYPQSSVAGEVVAENPFSPSSPTRSVPSGSPLIPHHRSKRRISIEFHKDRRPTFSGTDTTIAVGSGGPGATSTGNLTAGNTTVPLGPAVTISGTASTSSDSEEETGSRINSEDDTEEDVCLPPVNREHKRINGIDFDEIEEFVAMQQLENWYPELTRRADDDMSPRLAATMAANGRTRNTAAATTTGADVHMHPAPANASPPSTNSPYSDYESEAKILDSTTETQAPPGGVVFDEKANRVSRQRTNTVSSGISNKEKLEMLKLTTQKLPTFSRPSFSNGKEQNNSPKQAIDRFSFFSSESEETIHAPEFSLLADDPQSFRDMFHPDNGTWWLDCLDPSDNEMRMLSKAFGIHPLTAEDIRTQETREKVELFKSYYFVCFRTFEHDKTNEEFLEPLNAYMVVFRDGIISFHFSPFQHTANVRRRIRQLRDYVTVSADWICYAIIDDITDGFAPVIHEIEKEADGIEDSVFVARECDFGDMLKRIGDARKTVMTLMRLLSGKADVIKMFAKRCNEHWDMAPKGEIGLYLGDIQDHIVTMYLNLSAYEKILSRSHANYLAQLQVESFHANNRVTSMLSRVTLIGTILVPLNLITGLFGMNVPVPGEGSDTLRWFFVIVGVIILIVVVMYFVARRWLAAMRERDTKRDD
ncbi:uncharacterized protein V1510DRAFT_106696 [Dipodascopsis tothii]|uniref:uncharacterized protein n=1 Tax=Dipodascopsis tothii TaxID=44089 RepID=UPI0034CE5059